MSVLTVISAATASSPKLSTNRPGVMEPPGISPAGLFAGMSEGAVSPVMATATSTLTNLEFVHSKMVRRVRISVTIVVVINVVVRQEFLKKSFMITTTPTLGRIHHEHMISCCCGGGTATEELSRWDIDFPEGFLVEIELMRGMELVLISTDTTAHIG